MEKVSEAKESMLNGASARPGLLIGVIAVLIIVIMYMYFVSSKTKKTSSKKKEEIEEDEDIVDDLISDINEKQKSEDE